MNFRMDRVQKGEGASTVPASANAGGRYAAGAGAGGTTSAETYVHEYPQAGVYGTAARESVPGTQSDTAAEVLPKGVPSLRTRWGTDECPFSTCNFGAFTDSTLKAYH